MDSSSAAAPEVAHLAADASGPAAARDVHSHLWVPGSRLRVRFLNGPSLLHRRVLRVAQIWSAYANISFEPSDDEAAEVRVAFNEDLGSWSFQGTQYLDISSREPTVNFSWLRVDSAIDELESTVLTFFGFVLGLAREHNNPDATILWKKETVYEQMCGPPNFWDKNFVDTMIFSKWPRGLFPFSKPFDPYSITAFPIPPEWTQDGFSIGRNVTISAGDREFISRLYPYADREVAKAPSKRKPGGGRSHARPGRAKRQGK